MYKRERLDKLYLLGFQTFIDDRSALAYANAHGGQSIANFPAPHFMQKGC